MPRMNQDVKRASSSANTSVTIPVTLSPGTYSMGAIADSADTQAETDETNKTRTATTTLVVR